ncbi:N,N-dimethylformamidase beta subunit family domain-containing protein [Rhizobium sp. AN80A]|uniref:N,N-dimethylformamidase beta subunit family domain-containing protein n=1 Tax=Rhizobium sp. AN80A TaxID=3040673 RepID=UPI0024B3B97F|nr:N,N-dimethylformamidase beta subunit family domain-containing protein [Rhizobium sp. AN80A]
MRNRLNHDAMAAVGFIEPWSVKAGSATGAFLSCTDPNASVRVVTLDRDEALEVDWEIERHSNAFSIREYDLGSWAEIPAVSRRSEVYELSLEILFTRNESTKPVVAIGPLLLNLVPDGGLVAVVDGESHPVADVRNERWYQLDISFSLSAMGFKVRRADQPVVAERTIPLGLADISGPICIGGVSDRSRRTLNARLGRIRLTSADQTTEWRFPRRGPVGSISPVQQGGPAIIVHNAPTFAVASPRFTGEVHDPRLCSDQFDAIHLHDDDFGGFDWAADLTVNIPEDARSGVYALEIGTDRGVERLPFFVRPREPRSNVAVLLPTATYLAYADEQLPPHRYPWHGSDRAHLFAIDNNFLSLYDTHSDLSGVSLTSSRRPRATLRDDYHYPLSNSPHLLPVDLQLLRFYARRGIAVDVLTDRDLHDEGLASLSPYSLVLTGSHPEYWSSAMMNGLDRYLGSGGSLGYLGGNGFYWVVAFDGDKMELRRGKNDIWSGRPGEMHLSMTGEPGGNWEDRGNRHPQALVGVTYVIMSFGASRPYRRLKGSYAAEYAWLFEGVGETFGDSGTVLGGAAGYEVDAVLRSEETPANLVRLAVADGFDDSFQVRPDLWLADDEAERTAMRRSDMTIYRHEAGGLVFSASSVAWIGALPAPGEDNDVGRIMLNLVGRFMG